jgi:hypothetical protein
MLIDRFFSYPIMHRLEFTMMTDSQTDLFARIFVTKRPEFAGFLPLFEWFSTGTMYGREIGKPILRLTIEG